MPKLQRFTSLSLVIVFAMGLLYLCTSSLNFSNYQLDKVANSNPSASSITVVWPRLISQSNQLDKFEADLESSGKWQIDSSFLLFREMTDSYGQPFYLVGSSHFKEFFVAAPPSIPSTCNKALCEVVAALPAGAEAPKPSSLGLKILDTGEKAKKLPIPSDFGLQSNIPILITPNVIDLARYEPTKYLLASYGWRLTPNNPHGLSATAFKSEISQLTSALTLKNQNVTINYDTRVIETLITNQDRINQHRNEALKLIVLLFLMLLLLLLFDLIRFNWITSSLFAISAILSIQFFWNFKTLMQIVIFALLNYLFIRLVVQLQDRRLVRRSLSSLALLRSSLRFIVSLSLLFSLTLAVILSGAQYFNRNQSLKAAQVSSQVPFDFTLKVGSSLDKPLDLGSLANIEALAPGTKAIPLIRSSATLSNSEGSSAEVNVLAVSSGRNWNEPSIPIPRGRTLSLTTLGLSREIDLLIWFRDANGSHFSSTTLGDQIRSLALSTFKAPLAIVAFELREKPGTSLLRQHALGESSARSFTILNGDSGITTIAVDGKPVSVGLDWNITRFKFSLQNGPIIIRPIPNSNLGDVELSKDIELAHSDLLLSGIGSSPIQLTKVSTIQSFAGVATPFLVMDLASYQAITANQEPGAIDPIEIWIKSENPRTFYESFKVSQFNSLQLLSRKDLEMKQNSSPYQQAWQKLFFATFLFSLTLLLISIAYFVISLNRIYRLKSYESLRYFNLNPPSIESITFIVLAAVLASIPLLFLARYIARVLA